ARFKGFEQKIEKAFGDSLTATLAAFGGKLKEELVELLPPKPESKEAKSEKKEASHSVELRKFEEQIAALTKQADEARAERDTERAKTRDATLRQRLAHALAPAGIDGARARPAVGGLGDAAKRVRSSDAGDAPLVPRGAVFVLAL
ncbi:hypothetical protein, partial [Clostridioides difficile]|uniref:hypothetical protein n=1 Tax=Clostridioides difficile TaxID=1496 RepID=UPI0018DE2DBA